MPNLDDKPFRKFMHLTAFREHYKESTLVTILHCKFELKIFSTVQTEVKLCSDKDLSGLLHKVP